MDGQTDVSVRTYIRTERQTSRPALLSRQMSQPKNKSLENYLDGKQAAWRLHTLNIKMTHTINHYTINTQRTCRQQKRDRAEVCGELRQDDADECSAVVQ